jgi:DNA-binding transcriptional regulator YdaS (Cro superfamily)
LERPGGSDAAFLQEEKKMPKVNKEILKEAIKHCGELNQLADKVGVSYKSVLDWTSGRSRLSIQNALKIEKVTERKIKAKDLIVDQWTNLDD